MQIELLIKAGLATAAILIVFKLLVLKLIVLEGRTALLYRNGRFRRVLGPGRHYFPRTGTTWKSIDMRRRVMTVAGQEVLSQDNVSVKVSLAVNWRVIDPELSVHAVEDTEETLRTAVQLALRQVIGEQRIEALVDSRASLSGGVLMLVEKEAPLFGVQVHAVAVKDITFAGELKRIFSEVVKAKQQGLAALERARGEAAALRSLANAARMLQEHPGLLDVRLLQSLDAQGGNTLVMNWPGTLSPRSGKPGV